MFELLIAVFIFFLVYLYFEMKKTTTDTAAEMPTPKIKAEKPVAAIVQQAAPKQPSAGKKAPIKPRAETSKIVAPTRLMAMPERVGLTAGSIWHYLSKNGDTPVAKLLKELPEEEKIIQRSIGWLAQEGKITLATNGQVETISLK